MQKLTVKREDFTRAVAVAGRVIERRNITPVLGSLRLCAKGGEMTVSGTDMDIQIDYTVPAKGKAPEDGIAIPDFRHIARAANAVGADDITFGCNADGKAGLTADMGALSFCGVALPGSDFPGYFDTVDRVAPIWTGTLTTEFLDALERVAPAISTEETRYYLNGVFFGKDEGGNPWAYNLVATDGHRLHIASVQIPDATGAIRAFTHGYVIIPHKMVALLLSMRPKKNEPAISMAIHPTYVPNDTGATETLTKSQEGSKARFRTNGTTLTGKFIDGTYPDYQRVIPQDRKLFAAFDRAALLRALSVILAFHAGKNSCSVKLEIGQTEAKLSRKWFGNEASLSGVPCEVGGSLQEDAPRDGFTVAFNARYLAAALNQFSGCEKVTLEWTSAAEAHHAPVVIGSNESAGFYAVVMPMRV